MKETRNGLKKLLALVFALAVLFTGIAATALADDGTEYDDKVVIDLSITGLPDTPNYTYTGNALVPNLVERITPETAESPITPRIVIKKDGGVVSEIRNAGAYEISVEYDWKQGFDQNNYTVNTPDTRYLTIDKATDVALTVTPSSYDAAYDGEEHSPAVSATDGSTFEYYTEATGWTTTVPSIKDVGTLTFQVRVNNPNYQTFTSESYTYKVTPAAAKVTVDANQSKVYGDADPTLTATVSGLVNGESASLISYTLTREPGEDAGEYDITFTNPVESQDNYTVTFVPGTFTITPAAATVTVDAGQSKVYGDADPTLTATVSGLKNGDDESVITYTLSREPGEDAGEYDITFTNPAETQGNYTVTFNPGTFTITSKPVTVTADDAGKVYGEADPTELTATVEGLVGEDSISYSVSRAEGENAGEYTIEPSGGPLQGGNNGKNYSITYKTGTFTITAITDEYEIKVTGNADTKVYNREEQSVSGYTVADYDKTIVLTGPEQDAANATAKGKDAAEYTMALSSADFTATSVNYTNIKVTVVPGTLKITPITDEYEITVTGNSAEKVYNGAEQSVSGYTVADYDKTIDLTGGPEQDAANATAKGKDVAEYTMALSSADFAATSVNYTNIKVTVVPGTLKITRATATVTAKDNDKTKVYGDKDPKLTATVTGLQGEDAESVITYTLSREAGENVGKYAITPAGEAVQGNYDVVYEAKSGTLEITRAKATVTADAKIKVYGNADPALTATVTGLQNGDEASVLTYTLTRDMTDDDEKDEKKKGQNVGGYVITPAGEAVQGNYDVEYVTGTLTIEPLQVTVTAAGNLDKNYGTSDAANGYGIGADKGDLFSSNITAAYTEGAEYKSKATEFTVKPEEALQELVSISKLALTREAGEDIGSYAFNGVKAGDTAVTGEGKPVGNFVVTYKPSDAKFIIIGHVAVSADSVVNTRSTDSLTIKVQGVLNDGTLTALEQPVTLTVKADTSTAKNAFYKGAKEIALGEFKDVKASQAVPFAMSYDYADAFNGADYAWKAGLPVGTTILVTAAGNGGAIESLYVEGKLTAKGADTAAQVVEIGKAGLTAAAEGGNIFKDGENFLLSASDSITVTVDSVTDEVVRVTAAGEAGSVTKYYPAAKSLTITAAELVDTFGVSNETVLKNYTNVTFELVDNVHIAASGEAALTDALSLAVDNAASTDASGISFNNRDEQITVVLPEQPLPGGTVTLSLTGLPEKTVKGSEFEGTKYVWDISAWKEAPTLMTTESVLTVTYPDRVGNNGTLTASPAKGTAQRALSMNIEPEPLLEDENGGFIGKKDGTNLEIYGSGIPYEPVTVTINGRVYKTTVSGNGAYEHEGRGQYSVLVNLSEIDVGYNQPVTVTVTYDQLNGGGTHVTFTYKDWCRPIIVASPVYKNYDFIYGFAEVGSRIYVTSERQVTAADGTKQTVTNSYNSRDNKDRFVTSENNNLMYYAFVLDNSERMQPGDTIRVWYTDIAGNKCDEYILAPQDDDAFDGRTTAEALGKNIVDTYKDGDVEKSEHRFVLPIEIVRAEEEPAEAEAPAADAEPAGDETAEEPEEVEPNVVTVPILAFKGYKVGELTVTQDGDTLSFDYTINEAFAYEGAAVNVKLFDEEPTIEQLRELDGQPGIDLSAPADISEFTGIAWVYAQFDVNLDKVTLGYRDDFTGLLPETEETDARWHGMTGADWTLYNSFQGMAE